MQSHHLSLPRHVAAGYRTELKLLTAQLQRFCGTGGVHENHLGIRTVPTRKFAKDTVVSKIVGIYPAEVSFSGEFVKTQQAENSQEPPTRNTCSAIRRWQRAIGNPKESKAHSCTQILIATRRHLTSSSRRCFSGRLPPLNPPGQHP